MNKQDGKYLSFELSGQTFAVDICRVTSILNDFGGITNVPEFPEYSCGVINMRGEIVPVINTCKRFGLSDGKRSLRECIIVAETTRCKDAKSIGFLVDEVRTVADFEGDKFSSVPALTATGSMFLDSMYKSHDRIILVVDVDKLVGETMAAAVDDYMEKQR